MYWDEIGVYGPGILYMLDHGIGLLPTDLDPELSRGHPLFFYFLFACWSKVMGYSLFKLHAFALGLTLALFASVFYVARKMGEELPALGLSLWLMCQGGIFAQSSLALPEILLSLELIWALYFFFKKRYLAYAICAALALLTKESALVLPAVCVVWSFGEYFFQKRGPVYKEVLWVLSPLSIYLGFLVIQKASHGWFFFPYHVELLSFDIEQILKKLGDYATWLFVDQGRLATSFVLAGILTYALYKKAVNRNDFFIFLLLFLLGFLGFSMLNAYMDRYVLVLFAVLAVAISLLISQAHLHTYLQLGIYLLLISSSLLFFSQKDFRFDVDINYREYLHLQKEATQYLEAEIPPQEVFLGNFPLFNGFQDPRFGFASDTLHNSVTVIASDSLRYRAILVPPSFANALPKEGELIKIFEQGYTRLEVYRKGK